MAIFPSKGHSPSFCGRAGHQGKCGGGAGNLIDEAPTYAAILGVEMPWARGAAMTEILKHANGGNEM
ncbi:MAG: hypothetical protein ACLR0U_22650 [Enterocloster clostridioformis]